MKPAKLFESYKLSDLKLSNRIVMAPLTRQRADDRNIPTKDMATYYKQRASAGLIISEGSQISPQGYGYYNSPGIYNDKQIKGWKKVTKAIHHAGGRIFLQLWHVGRHSHPVYQPNGGLPVAPSAVREKGHIRWKTGKLDTVTPRALNINEIRNTIDDYKNAALNAIEAGFDGVEIHGANGYLIDQFLQNGTNKRKDIYGGSIENRSRFMLEVTEAVADAVGKDRTAIRLSPGGLHGDMSDTDPVALFSYAIRQLNSFKLAYLHLSEPVVSVDHLDNYLKKVTPFFRKIYNGTLISCGGYDFESASSAIEKGEADLIAFGKLFISNPDLVERFKTNTPLQKWDIDTFYQGGNKGYIDYPFLKKDEEEKLSLRYCCRK